MAPAFKADAHAEELIHARLEAVDKAMESGDKFLIKYAVIALENWILGEGVGDPDCLHELERIEKEWATTYEKQLEANEALRAEAICPDLLQKPPNQPPLEYYRGKYIAMWSLCQRKKLLFRHSRTVEM